MAPGRGGAPGRADRRADRGRGWRARARSWCSCATRRRPGSTSGPWPSGGAGGAGAGGGFYAAQEVADLTAYVTGAGQPARRPGPLRRSWRRRSAGVGADGLAILGLAAAGAGRPPWEVLEAAVGGASRRRSRALAAIEAGRSRAPRGAAGADRRGAPGGGAGLGPAELLVRSGYAERALGSGDAAGLANVRKLLRLAREFEAREGRDLRRFADRLERGGSGRAGSRTPSWRETEAVRLMTIHAAKGLEFPVVCLADLGHGPPTGLPMILTDGERVGLRVPTLAATRTEAFAYAELRARRDAAALAEEQRIAYVAMTRARERLILSGAADFARWPAVGAAAPAIAWLGPALVPDLRARLDGPPGWARSSWAGARVRLTLTAAGEDPVGRPPGPGGDAAVGAGPRASRSRVRRRRAGRRRASRVGPGGAARRSSMRPGRRRRSPRRGSRAPARSAAAHRPPRSVRSRLYLRRVARPQPTVAPPTDARCG